MARTCRDLYMLTWKRASRHKGVHFFDISASKSARTRGNLYILTSKCASRHNRVHFFNISTSKSGPNMVCFAHVDFQMCFAPQRGALFQHLNFQSGPNMVCFAHVDFQMCFAPQGRALFHYLNFQQWSDPGVCFYMFTSTCVSCHKSVHFFDVSTFKSAPDLRCFVHFDLQMCFAHNGVQFFICHLTSWLRTRRFSEPTFRPSGATKHLEKQSFSRLPYLFRAPASSLF